MTDPIETLKFIEADLRIIADKLDHAAKNDRNPEHDTFVFSTLAEGLAGVATRAEKGWREGGPEIARLRTNNKALEGLIESIHAILAQQGMVPPEVQP